MSINGYGSALPTPAASFATRQDAAGGQRQNGAPVLQPGLGNAGEGLRLAQRLQPRARESLRADISELGASDGVEVFEVNWPDASESQAEAKGRPSSELFPDKAAPGANDCDEDLPDVHENAMVDVELGLPRPSQADSKGPPSAARSGFNSVCVGATNAVWDFTATLAGQAAGRALLDGLSFMSPPAALLTSVGMLASFAPASRMAGEHFAAGLGQTDPSVRMACALAPMAIAIGLPLTLYAGGSMTLAARIASLGAMRAVSNVVRDAINQLLAPIRPGLKTVGQDGKELAGAEKIKFDNQRTAIAAMMYGLISVGSGSGESGSTAQDHMDNWVGGSAAENKESGSFPHRLSSTMGDGAAAALVEAADGMQAPLVQFGLAMTKGYRLELVPGSFAKMREHCTNFDNVLKKTALHSGMRFNMSLFATGLLTYAREMAPAGAHEALDYARWTALAATEFRGLMVNRGAAAIDAENKGMAASAPRGAEPAAVPAGVPYSENAGLDRFGGFFRMAEEERAEDVRIDVSQV